MKQHRPLILLVAILILLIWTPKASAHRPASTNEGVTELPDISTSFAYYQELETADAVHQFTFTAEAGDFFHAGINIPAIDGLEDYGVVMALIGPGLPPIPAQIIPGAQENEYVETGIISPSTISEDFYEPFTQTNYWGRQTLELNLPESGEYVLVIWNPQGETGKYVLDTGTQEVFGPGDLFRFPAWWVSVHAYFEHTLLLIIAGLITTGLAGFTIFVGLKLWRRVGRSRLMPNRKQESFA